MASISVRELNANLSRAIARAEAGEVIEITRNGKAVVELRAKGASRMDDPAVREAHARMMAALREGIPGLSGPATYEERTGR